MTIHKLALLTFLSLTSSFACAADARVMTVGDSIAQGYGMAIGQWFKGSRWELVNGGIVSSGLVSKKFNWIEGLPKAVNDYNPNVILISIGANDVKDLQLNGKNIKFGSNEWNWEYAKRSCYFGSVAKSTGARVIWMPSPPSRDDAYNNSMSKINAIHQLCAERTGAKWVVLPPQLGNHEAAKVGFMRSPDGLHLSMQGYRLGGEWALRIGLVQ